MNYDGNRSPMWEFSPNTIPLLERHGFEYTGDLMDTLLPNYHVVNERTTTMINLPGHWILDDPRTFLLSHQRAQDQAGVRAL